MDQTQNKTLKRPTIGEYLFGSAIDFSLEHRFFNATCLFSIVVASVSTIFNTLLILDILLISTTLAAVLMFVFLYYKSRVKKIYKTWMLIVYVFFTLSSFVFIWFFNAGVFGPNGYILIILSGFVIILVSKKYTFAFIAIFTLYALGLIFVEYFFPNISISYESEEQRFFDFAWTISISIIMLTLGISVLKNNYRSERQENLEQREEAKEKYLLVQSMLRSSPDAIIITDLHGIIVDCNEQTPFMFGYKTIEEITGMNAWETFISRTDYLRALSNQRKTIEGAPSKNIEYKAHCKEESELFIEVSSNVVNDASGKPMYIVNTARDISERVAYEDGLRAARKKAEELNQAKSVFLAKISHELRTPLNGVLGFSDLLIDQENDPDKKAMIENIRYSGNTLLRLINDILDLSRIESQKLSFEQQTFNFPVFLDSIKIKYERISEEKRIAFSIKQSGSIPENINSDPLRIEQVLVNLLNNAFKFTSKGEINLTVTAEKLSFHKSELIFTVSDTGIGIPKDKTHRLFEVFSQLHTQAYQPSEGLGLGLSIVKNLIKMMNGSIRVESEENVGTKFTVRIPVLLETHIENLADKFNQTQFRNISPEKIYILIAEDDPINQILIRRNMEKYKIRYDLVHNGLQAVEMYEKNNYNLILMDIQMPEMDGYAATQIIKQSEKYKSNPAPVIAMTAFAMKGDREQFIEKGMDEYISKPINFEKLIQLMEKI